MGNNLYIQNNFSHGELDPRMFSNVNLDIYYKSLKRARNVYVRPQGGVKRRHGTEYKETLPADSGKYKMAAFIFDEDNEFLVIFLIGNIYFYKIDSDGNIASTQILAAAMITTDNISDIQYAQHSNQMIVVHPDFQPQVLSYDTGTSLFTITPFVFKINPVYDYQENYYTDTFYLDNVNIGPGRKLTWVGGSFTNVYNGGIFISLGSGQLEPIGVARIITVTAPTTATVDVIYPFDASVVVASPVSGQNCYLAQPAYSSTVGWPKCVSFYEDRLILAGGNEKLAQTIFLSYSGSFQNFDLGDGSDDNAITSSLSTDSYNIIKYIISDKTLQIFCSESAFSSVQTFDEPLTPTSASFRKQAGYGCNNLRPLIYDNRTFYCREGGNNIMEYVFDPNSNSYAANPVSTTSAILIENPERGAVLKGDAVDDADFLFLVNSDGSLVVYQSLSYQNISAFTICATGGDHVDMEIINPQEGKFKDIVNVGKHIFTIVERLIDNITVQYLEKLSFDYYTDSSTTYVSPHNTTTISGLTHLIGQRPQVTTTSGIVLRVDNDPDPTTGNGGKVKSDGTLLLLDAAKSFKVGLPVNLLVETIPANIMGSSTLYLPKKIVRLWVDYYESIGIKVNGSYIPELKFGVNVLDKPPIPQTGIYVCRGSNWGERVSIQITQEDPLPFLVIGLGYEVTE